MYVSIILFGFGLSSAVQCRGVVPKKLAYFAQLYAANFNEQTALLECIHTRVYMCY